MPGKNTDEEYSDDPDERVDLGASKSDKKVDTNSPEKRPAANESEEEYYDEEDDD